MRSGHMARLVGVTGVLLVTGACASPGGVAGISTLPPAPSAEAVAAAPGAVTATIPSPTQTAVPKVPPVRVTVERPKAGDPVQVPPPKVSGHTYAFPVKDCRVTYESRLLVLPKTTVWAAKGCSFVSPVNGVVHEVNTKNRWKRSTDRGADREGRFVSVIGDDGVRYLGGHLDRVTPGIVPGTRVSAGQVLGQVGNSGNARYTASNLYFAISWKTEPSLWWVRRGMVRPWNYLDAWLNGNRTLSPKDEMQAVLARTGAAPRCVTLCTSKPGAKPKRTEKPPKPDDEHITVGG
ncbi:Murein DD-endopeptidase MepM and murein hydrolase activator NlpD, contain LysM domain [Streptosporangium canum]|uniref:Murein DD-endopeptidase MepM and murein hydrolase activator NlpD, contain LysM domain n=2 Tax=Streptosporangium canum TaxID=324952 RepID=A0A1I3SKU6_9ACTN|nr:Murein DD-endopeptidase MepM and murein hydrolase activator NlpD, contain LysM domain [Streptosporangium canum]